MCKRQKLMKNVHKTKSYEKSDKKGAKGQKVMGMCKEANSAEKCAKRQKLKKNMQKDKK